MKLHRLLLLVPLALVACSGSSSSTSSSGTSSASSTASSSSSSGSTGTSSGTVSSSSSSASASSSSGSSGSTGACAPGSHASDGGPNGSADCETTLDPWTLAGSFPNQRDHHVTFALTGAQGTQLYVAGGANRTDVLADCEAAPVEDGGLGAFAAQATLPAPILGQSAATLDATTVVLSGGLDGTSNTVTTVTIGALDATGAIQWTAGPSLSHDRYHASASVHGGYVYVIGGLKQSVVGSTPTQSVEDAIERAPVTPGGVGTWEDLTPLPVPLTHQAAVVHGDSLYLVGGISTTTARTEILRADFAADGTLGAFTQVGTLPAPRATSAAVVFLDHLYVIAGSSTATGGAVDTVLRAPFLPDGSVGAFESLAALPSARQHAHQAPLIDGAIYSAGGSRNNLFQVQVYRGALE